MNTFVKVTSQERAVAEVKGWQAVAPALPVPSLLGHGPHGTGHAVFYEDVFATARCQHLLGDCIGLADHGRVRATPVSELVKGVCTDLADAVERSGRWASLRDCVPALYLDRLRPGGRIDTWYPADSALTVGTSALTVGQLATFEIVVNGSAYQLDLPAMIGRTRLALHPRSRWMTAVTQGDPTEPNIACPRVWLDFEHGGRNTLAGDVANLLWYLLGLGGWLVPRYQPEVYQRTLRHHLPPVSAPAIEQLAMTIDHHRVDVATRWHVGPGRTTAIRTLRTELDGQLGAACAAGRSSLMSALRPFLVARILGVIRLGLLDGTDTLLCLAKLAHLQDPRLTLDDLLSDLAVAQAVR